MSRPELVGGSVTSLGALASAPAILVPTVRP